LTASPHSNPASSRWLRISVSNEAAVVNVEAGGNTSAVVLKGDALGALSDDPDELANELSALAGPSAGPNGGEIFIDGFSGGELPPKSAILEIPLVEIVPGVLDLFAEQFAP
jgi:hypothetical protein